MTHITIERAKLEQTLAALENISAADSDCDEQTQREDDAVQEAITAIREALAAPVQEPFCIDEGCPHHGTKHICINSAAPVQKPVAWMDGYRNIYSLEEKAAGCEGAVIPLVPLANQKFFAGSPINPLIEEPEPDGIVVGFTDEGKAIVDHDGLEEGWVLYTTPPAAQPTYEHYTALEQSLTRLQKRYGELEAATQRQWVGLTEAEVTRCWNMTPLDTANNRFGFYLAINAKLKEKNQ